MAATPSRILSVGQCHADHPAITRFLRNVGEVEVTPAQTAADAQNAAQDSQFDLILVNRIFDLDGGSGLDLIQSLKADPQTASVPVMLVSNYPDAQAKAVSFGAISGFGKSELGDPDLAQRVRDLLQLP